MTDTNGQTAPSLHVISGNVVREIVEANRDRLVDIVERTYADHEAGRTINPDSYFLRYPDNDLNRIIALPAAIRSKESDLSGIKWVASFPDNVNAGLARASAVLVLNDNRTGYPYAFMEAATISAARTAASAVLAANHLHASSADRKVRHVSVVGSGIIAKHILEQFVACLWSVDRLTIHDLNEASASGLVRRMADHEAFKTSNTGSLDEALSADIVIFVTSAGTPYLPADFRFKPGQLALNISLRDIRPEQIMEAQNIFDDVEHCLKANTSAHLAEQMTGGREFVTGTISQIIRGKARISNDAAVIYSPFGMGILDLAVGDYVYSIAKNSGAALEIKDFFGEFKRWTD